MDSLRINMNTFKHFDSLEFGLAEKIWNSANDKETRIKAINFYKMAAAKNDARALLVLYEINSDWITSYIITGRQHSSLPYLYDAMKLGYVPSFFYASDLDVFSLYARLIYLSTGLAIAQNTNDLLVELQEKFIKLSEDFAIEFIPEIIRRGQEWDLGNLPNTSDCSLDGQLVTHPCRYDPNNDRVRGYWTIIQSKNIEQYLKQLPGSDEYFLAYKFADEGDSDSKETYLSLSASRGNGQALYALHEDAKDLIKAAENGSPDAFEDLTCAILTDIPDDVYFKNFAEIPLKLNNDFMSRIDCLLYLYTLMERLGIEKNAYWIEVRSLSIESETGYAPQYVSMHQLKYLLCGHDQIVEINDRAEKWLLGKKFDAKFQRLFIEINQ